MAGTERTADDILHALATRFAKRLWEVHRILIEPDTVFDVFRDVCGDALLNFKKEANED